MHMYVQLFYLLPPRISGEERVWEQGYKMPPPPLPPFQTLKHVTEFS